MGRVIALFMIIAGIGGMIVLAIGWGLWDRNFHLVFLVSAAFLVLFSIPTAITLAEKEPTSRELKLSSRPHQSVTEYLRNVFSHRSLVILFASNFFRALSYAVSIHFILLFAKEDLSIAVGVASLAVLAQQATRMLVMPVAGLAADRFERKTMLVVSSFVVAVGALAGYFLVKDVATFIGFVIFLGLSDAVMGVSAASMIMDLLPEGRSGEFLGLNSIMEAIPFVIGALGGGIINELMGEYRGFLLLYAAGMALSALFVLKIESSHTTSKKVGDLR
jgi:MFS family permease